MLKQCGGRVGVRRLLDRIGRAFDAPQRLTALAVDLHDVRRIVGLHPVQDLDVERSTMQQRRRGVPPVESKGTIVLLDVAHPQLFPLEVERPQHASTRHDPDRRAVGDWRRGRHVLLALHVVPAAEGTLPQDVALDAVHSPQLEVAILGLQGHVQKDVIVPDDRRRAAAGRHGKLPGKVLFRSPLDGQALFCTEAIQLRTAPLGPVLRSQRGSTHNREGQRQRNSFRHEQVLPTSAATDRCPGTPILFCLHTSGGSRTFP